MGNLSRARCDADGTTIDGQLQLELEDLEVSQLKRTLRDCDGRLGPRMIVDGREVLMLAGSNYLDLASDPRVVQGACEATRAFGCAAGGARLISGNLSSLHEALERELAGFMRTDAALLFSTGYMANLGVIATLAGANDVIVSDSLNHASTIDACRLSRAQTRIFCHNDPDDLRRVADDLAGFRRRILVMDGVFSMDGDVARLRDVVRLARQFDMCIVVDDAHGIGVLGPSGRGTAEEEGVEVDVQIGNLGKALGSFGAFVACSETMREYLVNKCRTFIFTCGLSPGAVGAARVGLEIIQAEPQRRQALLERSGQLRSGLQAVGYDTGLSSTHIIPAIVGANGQVMQLAELALRRGVYAQGIRYPSVPQGTARLRLTPMSGHTADEIKVVVQTFAELRHVIAAQLLRS